MENPLSFSPIRDVDSTFTSLNIISENASSVGSFDLGIFQNNNATNHILSNFMLVNRYNDPQYWYMKEYVKVPYHQHIQWTQDWLRDHFRAEHGKTLVPTPVDSIRGIIQQTGESVITHNNVKEWHLEESPEFCVKARLGVVT